MRSYRGWVLAGVLVVVLGAAGCTNSEVLSTGNSGVTIDIEVVNPLTRFSDNASPLERALFELSQVNVRPDDPQANAALGENPIGIIQREEDIIQVNLKAAIGDFQPTQLTLATGSYRISSFDLSNVFLQDIDYFGPCFDADPNNNPMPTSCSELGGFIFSDRIRIRPEEGADVDFSVSGTGTRIVVRFDAAALVTAFAESFNCTLPADACRPLFGDQFREADFVAQVPEFISVQ